MWRDRRPYSMAEQSLQGSEFAEFGVAVETFGTSRVLGPDGLVSEFFHIAQAHLIQLDEEAEDEQDGEYIDETKQTHAELWDLELQIVGAFRETVYSACSTRSWSE